VLMLMTKEATEVSSSVLKEPLVCVSLEYGESRRKERTSNLEQVPLCKPRTRRENVRERQWICGNLLFGERSVVSVSL
jgi:hypothetical protein